MKFATIIVAVMSMLSMSSCLNDSDSSDSYDVYDYVSLKNNYGSYYLLSDNGVTYNLISQDLLSGLKLSDGTYLSRFVAAIKLVDGETAGSGKKDYTVSKLAVYSQIVYTAMTTRPDTISGNYGVGDVSKSIWAANGYINVPFKYYYSSSTQIAINQFNLYATEAKEDTLCLTLQQSRKIGDSEFMSSDYQLLSYSMPFSNSDFVQKYYDLEPKNDSIVIKVTAKQFDQTAPIVRTTKYKYSDR